MKRWLPMLAAIPALSALAAPETHAAPAPKPDLIVPAGTLVPGGGDEVIIGRHIKRFTWNHRTKNVGTAAAAASTTAVHFVEGPGVSTIPGSARLAVPRLSPGRKHAGSGSFRVNFAEWEFGSYPTKICADFRDVVVESNEDNNCRPQTKIYVVPLDLRGRVTGNMALWPGGSVKVTWATTVEYDFARVIHEQAVNVDYIFSFASVNFRVQGTDPVGCTWTGHGTYEPPTQGVRLQFGREHRYRAQNFLADNFHFTVTRTCSGLPAQIDFFPASQLITKWLDTNGWRQFQNPGLEALRGKYIDNVTSTKPITYSWNLEAE